MNQLKTASKVFFSVLVLGTLGVSASASVYDAQDESRVSPSRSVYESSPPPSEGYETDFSTNFQFGEASNGDTFSSLWINGRQGVGHGLRVGVSLPFLTRSNTETGLDRSEMGNPVGSLGIEVFSWGERKRPGHLDLLFSASMPRGGGKDSLSHDRSDIKAGVEGYQPMDEGFARGDFGVVYRTPESFQKLGVMGVAGGTLGWELLQDLVLVGGMRARYARSSERDQVKTGSVSLITLEPEIQVGVFSGFSIHFAGYLPIARSSNLKGNEYAIGGIETPGLLGPTVSIGAGFLF